jgi:hypothetical protein
VDPASCTTSVWSYDVEEHPVKEAERSVTTVHVVDNDYFRALGIPLLKGREFDDRDDASTAVPVVVISQELAKQSFRGEDPVGKRIRPNISSVQSLTCDGRMSTIKCN